MQGRDWGRDACRGLWGMSNGKGTVGKGMKGVDEG